MITLVFDKLIIEEAYIPSVLSKLRDLLHSVYRLVMMYSGQMAIIFILVLSMMTSNPFFYIYLGIVYWSAAKAFFLKYEINMRPYMRRIQIPVWLRQPTPVIMNCKNPGCLKASCTVCQQLWVSPHTCYEKEKDSLRIHVELAMSQALIRTVFPCFYL